MAINPAHLDHIPAYLHGAIKVTRKDGKTGAIKVTFGGGCIDYFYKGYRIDLRENVPSGYYGRWRCNEVGSFSTLAHTVAAIDKKISENGKLHLPGYRQTPGCLSSGLCGCQDPDQ